MILVILVNIINQKVVVLQKFTFLGLHYLKKKYNF